MKGTWIQRPKGSLSVVFIHGILSDGDSCWTSSNGTYWPTLLAQQDQLKHVGIYVFEYRTGFFSGTYSLGDVVDALRDFLYLDGVIQSQQIAFVCHSMGGIVARRYLVQHQLPLIEAKKQIGLFLIASPSLGARYANWLTPIARRFNHTQAEALRFAQNNTWLNDLDRDFQTLKESRRLELRGKELVEDKFLVFGFLCLKQVVEPFAGNRYFGQASKIPGSDHFSIAKVSDANSHQHRLLVDFLSKMTATPTQPTSAEPDEDAPLARTSQSTSIEDAHKNVCRVSFSDPLFADIVDCEELAELFVDRREECRVEVIWPEATRAYISHLQELSAEARGHTKLSSAFHDRNSDEITHFRQMARQSLNDTAAITRGAGERAKNLMLGMTRHWGAYPVVANTLRNFLTLSNCRMIWLALKPVRFNFLIERYFPKKYEGWFSENGLKYQDYVRYIFFPDKEVYYGQVTRLGQHQLGGIYFWAPASWVVNYYYWRPGDRPPNRWVDQYLIPQNELRLLLDGSDDLFEYSEEIEVIKVRNSSFEEIERPGS